MKEKFVRWFAPVIVLILGAGVMAALVQNRPAPQKEEKKEPGALVQVITVERESRRASVTATGTVQPAQEITIIPQVSGRVVSVAPGFVSGGFFRKGALLFEIEDTDYRLAVEQAKAKKAAAEYEVSVTEGRARIARMEWERMAKEEGAEPSPLTLFEPQLKNARAGLASAVASLEQAMLDLERTKIRAPFNCIVRSEEVEIGQFLKSGAAVASLSGTDRAEVIVPLPLDELPWIEIPRQPAGGKGSPAIVSMKVNGEVHEWRGYVVRSLGELDPKSRMASAVVAVDDPYAMTGSQSRVRALAMGTFVEVTLQGRALPDVAVLPRAALREGSTVWVVDEENKLRVRKVTPLRVERDHAFIGDGLAGGEVVVLTTLSGAADGMMLRPVKEAQGS